MKSATKQFQEINGFQEVYRGCIKDALKTSEQLRTINISSIDELPFVMTKSNDKVEV
jgi:hypothetical protein